MLKMCTTINAMQLHSDNLGGMVFWWRVLLLAPTFMSVQQCVIG